MDPNTLLILIFLMTLVLLVTIIVFVIYSGLFQDFEIGAGKPPITNAKVYYKAGEGSYKDVGPVFCDVTSIAPEKKSFAIYYDNPNESLTRERWAVGVILAEGAEEPDSSLIEAFSKEGYTPFNFPKVQNVVKTTFPYISSLSVIFANYRVYPQLGYYVKEKKLCAHPWMEIYDGSTIHYMVPLAKQEEFYVPESLKPKPEQISERKHKRRKRTPNREDRAKRDESDCSDLEPNGTVNIENVPVIECEHSYATKKIPEDNESKIRNEEPVNSAGERIAVKETVEKTHNNRSKSVNILGPKPDSLVNVINSSKLRSSSATPHKSKPNVGAAVPALDALAGGDNPQTKLRDGVLFDRDTGNCSMEESINSSASSVSSSGDTFESSFFSSEYSYSSNDTYTSQNSSRYSCDSDKTF